MDKVQWIFAAGLDLVTRERGEEGLPRLLQRLYERVHHGWHFLDCTFVSHLKSAVDVVGATSVR